MCILYDTFYNTNLKLKPKPVLILPCVTPKACHQRKAAESQGRDRVCATHYYIFTDDIFKYFLDRIFADFEILLKFIPDVPIISLGTGHGLAPKRWQAIT